MFEGFLESYRREGSDLELRFSEGGFDPVAAHNPILVLRVTNVERIVELCGTFETIQSQGDDCCVEPVSDFEVHVHAAQVEPVVVRGSTTTLRPEKYGPRDFKRIAHASHQWGESQYQALIRAISKSNEVEKLVRGQHQRIEAKMQGHETGSTAHTLYEQQLRFLEQLLETLKA